jgi:cytidine deaminase
VSDNHDALVVEAITVRSRAYAPYSGFKVGAALLGDDGKVYVGVNVENAAYGSTICAERAALLAAIAGGCRQPLRLAIATDVAANHLSPPCGACCQVLAEFNPTLPIVLANLDGDDQETSLDQLYTRPFSARQLEG